MSTTTIRLPDELKERVAQVAQAAGLSAHAFIVQAIAEKTEQCRARIPGFETLNEPRQAVLIGMCFQMGSGSAAPPRGLLGFQHTLSLIRQGNFTEAAKGMRSSNWAHQTPKRAIRLAQQMETGEWS